MTSIAPISDRQAIGLIRAALDAASPSARSDSAATGNTRAAIIDGWMRSTAAQATQAAVTTGRSDADKADGFRKHYLRTLATQFAIAGFGADAKTARSDAATYYDTDLRAEYGSIIRRPLQGLDLLEAAPVRRIDPGADRFRLRSVDHHGSVAVYEGGDTNVRASGHTVAQRTRDLHFFIAKTESDLILQPRRDAFAGIDSAAEDARAVRRVMDEFQDRALLNGVAGLSYRGLIGDEAVDIARYESSQAFNDSATIDDMIADMILALQKQKADSNGVFRPDSAIISEPLLFTMDRRTNFSSGATDTALQVVQQAFRRHGIANVVPGYTLANGAVDGKDGALFYNAADANGLKHVVSLPPTPVLTTREGPVEVTYYLCGGAGWEAPHAGSAMLYTATVS